MKKAKNRSLTVTAQKRLCLLAVSCRVSRMLGRRKDGLFQQRLEGCATHLSSSWRAFVPALMLSCPENTVVDVGTGCAATRLGVRSQK